MKFVIPSRDDAWSLKRKEKESIQFLMNAVSCLQDAKEELAERISRIENGPEIMDRVASESLRLLEEICRTIPEDERAKLQRTASDYEMRLTPRFMPLKYSVVVEKEDFRTLVDAAQVKCTECADTAEECRKCRLYQWLVRNIPLDSYDGTFLCPYNNREWEN